MSLRLPATWRRQLPLLIVAVAFLLRLGYAGYQGINRPLPPGSDEVEYDTYAWNVAQGHGYRGMSPDVSDQDHLTAYRPPGPSLIFAAIYRVVGHHVGAIRVLNCFLGAVTCWLIVLLGRRTFGEGPALAAAVIWAVWPASIYLSGMVLSDQLALVTLLWLVLVTLRFADRPSLPGALVAGLVLGIVLLVHPSRVAMLPMLALWAVVQFWRAWKTLAMTTVVPLVALMVLVPWIVRNERVFGRFIPLSTMGGSVLLQGNNRITATDPEYLGYNVWDTRIPEYAAALRAPNDEVKRDSVAKVLAVEWIRGHPGRLLPMAIAKIRRGWTPFLQTHTARSERFAMLFSWGPILLLMLLGFIPWLIRMLKAHDPGWLLHLVILHMVALDVAFFGFARYRYVVEPYCILLATATVAWALASRRLGARTAPA